MTKLSEERAAIVWDELRKFRSRLEPVYGDVILVAVVESETRPCAMCGRSPPGSGFRVWHLLRDEEPRATLLCADRRGCRAHLAKRHEYSRAEMLSRQKTGETILAELDEDRGL